jgi:hypothetical protein
MRTTQSVVARIESGQFPNLSLHVRQIADGGKMVRRQTQAYNHGRPEQEELSIMKTELLCSVAVVSLCASGLATARTMRPALSMHGPVHRVISAVPGSVTLYDQNDDDAGAAVLSENFLSDFDSYDSYAADDFSVPAGHKWKVREVEATGIYGDNSEPADSENVLFYKDGNGLPGKPVAKCDNVKGSDNRGSFAIRLPKSCKVNLRGGNIYWISLVANENNGCCTFWDWETRSGQDGNPAAWENPNDGFGRCTSWEVMVTCIGDNGEGPDFMFTLKGTDVKI